jgi:EmrB/QacA subfamily drug resistance transporter
MSGISFSKIRIADKWLVMIAVTIGMFMSLMDSTIVNVAIPQMQLAFGVGIQEIQWVTTVYMLTQAAVIPTAPYLTKKFGGKRAYLWTLTAFLLGSLLCGLAWDLPSLVFFRLIQGIGGGILLPLVMTLLYQAFPTEERGTAVSAMGVPLMVAPMLGPVLGGYLVTAFGWPWAFFINIPLGIVALLIAQKALPQTPAEGETRFDGAGFFTAATGSALLLYGVSVMTASPNILWNILFLGGGLLLLLSFVGIELVKARRGQEPLLDLRRFRDRTFAFSALTMALFAFVRFGLLFLVPIYLQTLRQQSALQAGTILAVQALATLAILPLGGRLADRLGPQPVVMAGLILFASAAGLMVRLSLNTPLWLIAGCLILLGCSFGFAQQIPVSAMSRIEKDEHKEVANGSTLVTVLHATAAPLGVALFSSLTQARSQSYALSLAAQELSSELLNRQSILLGMRESFLLAAGLALVALVAMSFVPRREKRLDVQVDQTPIAEMSIS